MSAPEKTTPDPVATVSIDIRQLVPCFLKLGTVGFGGPIALCGYMQRDLVEMGCPPHDIVSKRRKHLHGTR